MNIEYVSCVTDLGEIGLKVETDGHGNYEIYDDKTSSFHSWNITLEEVQNELYACWKERIKQKSYTREAYDFERELGYHLQSLAKEIIARTWKPRGYYQFKVHHPERIISAPYYKDRIVEDWMTERFVKPFIEPKLHPNNVACRKDMGPPKAMEKVKEILNQMYAKYGTDFYFFQGDIQGYYDNVDHQRIKEQFYGMEALGYILFVNIIDDWKQEDGYAAQNNPSGSYGVPKGNLPSQWIGLSYLNEVDWYIAGLDGNEGQVRYMDDFLVFFHLKKDSKNCKIQTEIYLEEHDMGIRLHPKKTVYAPISRGFTFCGWHYNLSDSGTITCSVKNDRKKISKKRLKKMAEDYYLGKLTFYDVQQKLNGMNAFLNQGDTKQLQRYFTNRYIFTKDEKTFYKDRTQNFKKKKKHKEDNLDEEK